MFTRSSFFFHKTRGFLQQVICYNSKFAFLIVSIIIMSSYNLPYAKAAYNSNHQIDFTFLLNNATCVEPHEYDGTPDGAIEKANIILEERGNFTWYNSTNVTATAYLILSPDYCFGNEPVWLIIYHEKDNAIFKVLLRWDYKYISAAPWNVEFEQTGFPKWFDQQRDFFPHGLSDFGIWTQEEQADFSATYTPIIRELEADNPYISDSVNELYWLTRHTYGVPTSTMISLYSAKSIAQKCCVQSGVQENSLKSRSVEAALDITDPQKPIWRLRIGFDYDTGDFTRYVFQIDAYTGAVISIRQIEGVGYQYFYEVW